MQWQIQYFGSFTNPAAAPGADASGTGQNNLFKYTAGLNPTNRASVFLLQPSLSGNLPRRSFGPVWSNRSYTVQSRPDLFSGDWSDLAGAMTPAANASQMTFSDTNHSSAATFYRVGIGFP
jgi:hypothetical protein